MNLLPQLPQFCNYRHVSPWLATYWRVSLLLLFLVLSLLLLFSFILFSKETSLLFSIWALTFPLHHAHQGPSISAALLLSFFSIPAISMAMQLLHLVLNFHFLAPDDIDCFFMCMFAIFILFSDMVCSCLCPGLCLEICWVLLFFFFNVYIV